MKYIVRFIIFLIYCLIICPVRLIFLLIIMIIIIIWNLGIPKDFFKDKDSGISLSKKELVKYCFKWSVKIPKSFDFFKETTYYNNPFNYLIGKDE